MHFQAGNDPSPAVRVQGTSELCLRQEGLSLGGSDRRKEISQVGEADRLYEKVCAERGDFVPDNPIIVAGDNDHFALWAFFAEKQCELQSIVLTYANVGQKRVRTTTLQTIASLFEPRTDDDLVAVIAKRFGIRTRHESIIFQDKN